MAGKKPRGAKMKMIVMISLLFFVTQTMNIAAAGEIVRFDFQKYLGEGGYSFYRVDIDEQNSNGKLCYFDTGVNNVSEEVSKQLWSGVLWSRLLDLNKFKHACFKFELYKPDGWFYSPAVKYEDVEYRFFFVGQIKDNKMDGKLYTFLFSRPESGERPYGNAEEIKVSTTGLVLKK